MPHFFFGIICVPGSFAVQFGDHLRSWYHLRTRTVRVILPRMRAPPVEERHANSDDEAENLYRETNVY